MTPITLPPLAVIKARALEALNNNALQCQQPGFEPIHTPCNYAGPCAIGAALSSEDAKVLDSKRYGGSSAIENLLQNSQVVIHPDDPNTVVGTLINIQTAHDLANLTKLRELLETP